MPTDTYVVLVALTSRVLNLFAFPMQLVVQTRLREASGRNKGGNQHLLCHNPGLRASLASHVVSGRLTT